MNQNIPFSFLKYKHHDMQLSDLNTGLDKVCHYSMDLVIGNGITETLFLLHLSTSTIELDFGIIHFTWASPDTCRYRDRLPSSKRKLNCPRSRTRKSFIAKVPFS